MHPFAFWMYLEKQRALRGRDFVYSDPQRVRQRRERNVLGAVKYAVVESQYGLGTPNSDMACSSVQPVAELAKMGLR